MKKIRTASIVLLLFSTAVFSAFKIYEKISKDSRPPVITCPGEALTVSVTADESELMKDVKVEDDRSGDVSDSLVVESMSGFTEDGVRSITYAAIDEQGNVARKERVLRYEDYRKPEFRLSGPLRFPMGRTFDVLGRISASSVLDGDLSGNIKYSLEKTIDVSNAGTYPIEFRVADSGGKTVYLTTELEIYDPAEERVRVELSEYSVYLKVADQFEPKDYYVKSDPEEEQGSEPEIQSNVDMTKAGTYYVDYLVSGKYGYGKSRLIVVVSE